jgi:hypothetical protein
MRGRIGVIVIVSTICLFRTIDAAALEVRNQPPRSAAVAATDKPNGATPADDAPAGGKTPSLIIDLAAGQQQSWPLDPGTYAITLANAIPGETYSVIVGASALAVLPTLTVPTGSEVVRSPLPSLRTGGPCDEAAQAATALVGASSEDEVPKLRQRVQTALLKCADESEKAEIRKVISATSVAISDLTLQVPAEARKLVSVVHGPRVWNVTFSTASRGQWQTLFGWMFAPNHDDEYFSESSDGGKFVVRKRSREEHSLTSLPSVFFVFLPTDQAFGKVQHGPTVGLGVTVGESGSRPSVFAGYSVRYNQNIGLALGASIYPHRRLDGKYTVGQTVTDNLDSNQLNRDVIRVNLFFGALIRFGADPRKAPEEPAAKAAK